MNFELDPEKPISKSFRKLEIHSFSKAMQFIKNLPYERNSDKSDWTIVFREMKGTCSTKHALLKKLADENQQNEVKLMLGIFKMNSNNTSKVKNTLIQNGLDYIPEAHNYLKINDKIYDCTSKNSSEISFVNDLIQEIEIQPNQISEFKLEYHKNFLKKWIADKPFTLEEIWTIREQCIADLSSN